MEFASAFLLVRDSCQHLHVTHQGELIHEILGLPKLAGSSSSFKLFMSFFILPKFWCLCTWLCVNCRMKFIVTSLGGMMKRKNKLKVKMKKYGSLTM